MNKRRVVIAEDEALIRLDLEGLLADAGYQQGADGILTHPAHGRLSLDLVSTAGNRVRELVEQVLQTQLKAIGVEIVINNAGIIRDNVMRRMPVEDWLAVLNSNLSSAWFVTKHVIDSMTERGWGRVINISSVNGQKGQFGQTNYSAAKAGLHGFAKALAQEVIRKGVTVNSVSPGYVATDMVKAIRPDVLDKLVASIPIGRLAEPAEIAALVGFLASEEAGYITGANIAINGGMYMG